MPKFTSSFYSLFFANLSSFSIVHMLLCTEMLREQCLLGFCFDQRFRERDSEEQVNKLMHDAETWEEKVQTEDRFQRTSTQNEQQDACEGPGHSRNASLDLAGSAAHYSRTRDPSHLNSGVSNNLSSAAHPLNSSNLHPDDIPHPNHHTSHSRVVYDPPENLSHARSLSDPPEIMPLPQITPVSSTASNASKRYMYA